LTAAGPAAVKSWLPILNIPTRSATCFANFSAMDRESKSSETIRLLRGWASKVVVVISDPDSFGVSASREVAGARAVPGTRRNGSSLFSGRPDRIHQFRALLDKNRGH